MSAKRSRHKGKASRSKAVKAVSQVRIIGGQFKRQWVPFIDADGLRPSPDRLRETVFNWLQFELADARVLDLCAGSGVLGFEALSRGATHVTFIELQSKQAELINETAQKLKLVDTQFELHLGDALSVLPHLSASVIDQSSAQLQQDHITNGQLAGESSVTANNYYHLVFIDPPYDLDLWLPILQQLIENKLIDSDSLIYIEDRRELSETLDGFTLAYEVLKSTKVGQIHANLIQIKC
ncbi:16S rRNA (guanine(966)-N(2))-methyltransferase RsmD [Psychrobacter sp. FDAARGOS_221]|uniref:16S rRNA (guanine(966)-N(2))-methyltransferase RsmD n=1 Tax=Psychrobacter sp. FDAARGOS_221 TaxID=1975705 RepID=UPI000BB59F42|nr:16S rRNA (guanine(966)-N(2))-methyltransferase RsmD [Psychrobacter sp. FDAARGOS_221]PNK61568.1 16S rRNA (guanine(966)-N(2))-methyltransferase RsmD [Psychrobacter sp. FDAARGOS_221]